MEPIEETRRLDFSPETLAAALRASVLAVVREEHPDTELAAVELDAEKEAVFVRWRTGKRAGNRTIPMDPTEIGAVLISYCRLSGIPLPRNAEKSVEILADRVSLILRQAPQGRPDRVN